MPRICNRQGCGKLLMSKDGRPDYRSHFCGRQCKNADSREAKQVLRERIRQNKCPLCGHRPPKTELRHASMPGVSQDNASRRGPRESTRVTSKVEAAAEETQR